MDDKQAKYVEREKKQEKGTRNKVQGTGKVQGTRHRQGSRYKAQARFKVQGSGARLDIEPCALPVPCTLFLVPCSLCLVPFPCFGNSQQVGNFLWEHSIERYHFKFSVILYCSGFQGNLRSSNFFFGTAVGYTGESKNHSNYEPHDHKRRICRTGNR